MEDENKFLKKFVIPWLGYFFILGFLIFLLKTFPPKNPYIRVSIAIFIPFISSVFFDLVRGTFWK